MTVCVRHPITDKAVLLLVVLVYKRAKERLTVAVGLALIPFCGRRGGEVEKAGCRVYTFCKEFRFRVLGKLRGVCVLLFGMVVMEGVHNTYLLILVKNRHIYFSFLEMQNASRSNTT